MLRLPKTIPNQMKGPQLRGNQLKGVKINQTTRTHRIRSQLIHKDKQPNHKTLKEEGMEAKLRILEGTQPDRQLPKLRSRQPPKQTPVKEVLRRRERASIKLKTTTRRSQ